MALLFWIYHLSITFYAALSLAGFTMMQNLCRMYPHSRFPILLTTPIANVIVPVSAFFIYSLLVMKYFRNLVVFLSSFKSMWARLVLKLIITLAFHSLFSWLKKDITSSFLVYLWSFLVCQVKVFLSHDTTGIQDEVVSIYLRETFGSFWKGHIQSGLMCTIVSVVGLIAILSPPTATHRFNEIMRGMNGNTHHEH